MTRDSGVCATSSAATNHRQSGSAAPTGRGAIERQSWCMDGANSPLNGPRISPAATSVTNESYHTQIDQGALDRRQGGAGGRGGGMSRNTGMRQRRDPANPASVELFGCCPMRAIQTDPTPPCQNARRNAEGDVWFTPPVHGHDVEGWGQHSIAGGAEARISKLGCSSQPDSWSPAPEAAINESGGQERSREVKRERERETVVNS